MTTLVAGIEDQGKKKKTKQNTKEVLQFRFEKNK